MYASPAWKCFDYNIVKDKSFLNGQIENQED